MRKLVLLIVIALVALPSAALAAKPPRAEIAVSGEDAGQSGRRNRAKPARTIMYVLRGKLSQFMPAQGAANGSITIEVKRANHHGRSLRGVSLTFVVTANTKVVLNEGLTTIANGDRGMVKVRAPKRATAEALQGLAARQVIDQQSSDS